MKSFLAPLSVAIALLISMSSAEAAFIAVKPIQICDDAGANCANAGFFEAETDKIWAQAGIDVRFLPTTKINETDWLNVDYGNPLPQEPIDMMEYARVNINDSNVTLAINMFFVDSMPGLYGLGCGAPVYAGFCGAGRVGVFITDDVYTFNGGIGRLDTIAHELGHVLGLTHDDWGAGVANNLMTAGIRTVPSTIDDISPDGAKLSQLTAAQITEVYNSAFIQVPEPGTFALIALALASVTVLRRSSRQPVCRESSRT